MYIYIYIYIDCIYSSTYIDVQERGAYKQTKFLNIYIYTYHIIVNANICTHKYKYINIYIYILSLLCKTSSSLLWTEGSLSSPNESRRIGQLWLLYMCTQDLRFKYVHYLLMCMHIRLFMWIYVCIVCMYIQIICNHLHMHIYIYIYDDMCVCKCLICTQTLILNKLNKEHIFMYVTLSPSLQIDMHK